MGNASTTHRRIARRLLTATAVLWGSATVAMLLAPGACADSLRAVLGIPVAPIWLLALDAMLGACAAAGMAGWTAAQASRRRAQPDATVSQSRLHAVQAIVDAHGEDSLAPFIVRPDKRFELVGETVIAYRQIGRTLVISGDPVGPREQHSQAFAELRARCAAAGLTPVVYGAGAADLDGYRSAGMRAICVGEEAIVDPAGFSLQGRAIRKVRQSVQRVQARGWEIETFDGRELDERVAAEIESVEQAWRADHPRMLGFAMSFGVHEHGARPDDLLVLARAPEGDLRAVMRFLAHRGNLSLDTMRRVGETPNGLNEALVCAALAVARERGVAEVSLNYAGLANMLQPGAAGGPIRRAARRLGLRLLSRSFQLERLVRFNEKFGPVWRERYLVYPSRAALPAAILRVLQAEGYVRTWSRPDREPPVPAPKVGPVGAEIGTGR